VPERAAHNHPSLARERTALAWGRTDLSLVAVAALAIRAAVVADDPAAALAALIVLVATVAGLRITRRAGHRATAADPRVIARDARALVTVVTVAGAAAAVLAVLTVLAGG